MFRSKITDEAGGSNRIIISTRVMAMVVKQQGQPLLGLDTAKEFGLVKFCVPEPSTVAAITGLEPFNKIKGVQVEIPIDVSVKPVWQPYRRIPVPLEKAVDEKIDELLQQDIIEPVNEHSSWVSSMVIVPKAGSNEVRICIDMRRANQAIKRENHPLPVMDDFLPHIKGATVFSKLDIKQAFHQVELAPGSRYITTFITKKGLYRYKRLMFGISCAPELFQKLMEQILSECEGCVNFADDIVVDGENMLIHDKRLEKELKVLKDNNVLLNEEKCVFRAKSIKFLGHVLNEQGVQPSRDKIEAIKSFAVPTTPELVRSFLGMVNFLGQYIPNLATFSEPLRNLLRKEEKFVWGSKQQDAFEILKDKLTSELVLGYFDVNDRTLVFADASPVGLGAVLVQIARDGPRKGQPRVIAYASKSLSEVEKRYCQTEKEALALVWAVERFHFYLYGKCFDLITDHKALETIFGAKSRPCARIERWVVRLQSYRYKIVYRAGKSNIADPLSRLAPLADASFREHSEHYVNFVATMAVPNVFLAAEIAEVSRNDPEICAIKRALNRKATIETRWADVLAIDPRNKLFKLNEIELCLAGDILLRTTRIVMPRNLRKRTLELAHEDHPGITVMKKRLRSKVWWPGMDSEAEMLVKNCRACILVAAPDPPEPLSRMNLPKGPWQHLAIDLLGPLPNGINILTVIDYFSRYYEIDMMKKTETKWIIKSLRIIFARFGIPLLIQADNGPQFACEEFQEFCKSLNIKIVSTIPYWPQQNGLVERQNRSLLKILRISHNTGGDMEKDLLDYLLMYRSTVHPSTGRTPSEMMFGWNIRDKLPQIGANMENDEATADYDQQKKEKGKVERGRGTGEFVRKIN